MNPNYPNDADGDALRRVASRGSDMSRPIAIDFSIAVADEATGVRVASAARSAGYESKVWKDDESGNWTCYCTKTMLATYDAVVAAQDELDEIAGPFGGRTDGWGTCGNVDAG
jgi:regulator of RNase E activity RraB